MSRPRWGEAARVWLTVLILGVVVRAESAEGCGRQVVREMLEAPSFSKAVFLNARDESAREIARKVLLESSPDSPKGIDRLMDEATLLMQAELRKEEHRLEVTMVLGAISSRSRGHLLARGVAAEYIATDFALMGMKMDGADIADVHRGSFARMVEGMRQAQGAQATLDQPHSSGCARMLDIVLDKEGMGFVVFGAKSPDWQSELARLEGLQPGYRGQAATLAKSASHLFVCSGEFRKHKFEMTGVVGAFDQKIQNIFTGVGIPPALVTPASALLAASMDGKSLKGAELEDVISGKPSPAPTALIQPSAPPPAPQARNYAPGDIEQVCRSHGLEYRALGTDSHLTERATEEQLEYLEKKGVKIYRAKIFKGAEAAFGVSIVELPIGFSAKLANEVLAFLEPPTPCSIQGRYIYCYMWRKDPKSRWDEPIWMTFEDFISRL